jgi:hypothetical protein
VIWAVVGTLAYLALLGAIVALFYGSDERRFRR